MDSLKQIPDGQRNVLRAIMLLVSCWDAQLLAHCEQVARELLALAPAGEEEEWFWAGLLHDVGKIGIPAHILCKRGKLTRKEKQVVCQHPIRGAALLKSIDAPQTVVMGVKHHHARWDGAGYPSNVAGDQIPMVARVLAVADTFTVLTSERPYHHALGHTEARLEIERYAGTQFDPQVVERFFRSRKDEGGRMKDEVGRMKDTCTARRALQSRCEV